MAGITRKMLKAMGLSEEQEDQIIEAHLSVVDSLKEERDKYKSDSDKAELLQSRVKQLEEMVKDGSGENAYKDKYEQAKAENESIKKQFEEYKNQINHENEINSKKEAYGKLLKEIGISEKRINAIIRATPEIDELITLDKDGDIKDKAKISDKIRSDWADFITISEDKKSAPDNPPENRGGKTKEEIMNIKDTTERQKAIAENHELFGF